jgi:hypothetical protein
VRYTPASAATSLAGSYRPQWTKLKRSGGSDGDDDESELRDGDVRASCSLLRAFLIELPQPLIPNELFLPLLETTKAWAPTVVEHRQHEVSVSHGSLGWSLDGLSDSPWIFCSDGFWMFCFDNPLALA